MATKHLVWSLTALAALSLGACSLTLDTNKKACSADKDCSAPYFCTAGLCTAKTGCDSDAECRPEGDAARESSICESPAAGQPVQCIAGCVDSEKDCEDGFACVQSRCVEAECRTAEDCRGASPTVMCVNGSCIDQTWGCIGDEDDRPEPMSAMATFKARVIDVLTNDGIPTLEMKVCPPALLHTDCATEIPGAKIDYDAASGQLTITGLKQGSTFRLKVDDTETDPNKTHLPVDFYTQRPVRDVTEEPQPLLMVPPATVSVIEGAFPDITVDTENFATFIIRAFDCTGKEAPGVEFELAEPGQSEVFYLDQLYTPKPDDVATDATGSGGIINVLPAPRPVTVIANLYESNTKITEFRVAAIANRMTYLNFWPRDYAK